MPLSMKIQPLDGGGDEEVEPPVVVPAPVTSKPVVKSRLKRLFRISVAEKEEPQPPLAVAATAVPPPPPTVEMFEPSSVCLAKMVQNFIEESHERQQSSAVKCGRNRCNCFNGNGSDGSDGDNDGVSSADVCDFLRSLVMCASVNERNVLSDTAKAVAEKSKACKRKDELRKLITEALIAIGYDAAICKSKWDKSPSFPAGEYEYVDVIVGGERLIIDIDFRSEFEVARSTKTYKSILQVLPNIFVGKSDRLSKIICILSEATKQSLKKKGMHIPPWRKADYVLAKWLSPPTRVVANSATVTPPPSPLSPVSSIGSLGQGPVKPLPVLVPVLCETHQVDGSEASSGGSAHSETVFDMSESSGEEDTKVKHNEEVISVKRSSKIVTGLSSIMEEKL